MLTLLLNTNIQSDPGEKKLMTKNSMAAEERKVALFVVALTIGQGKVRRARARGMASARARAVAKETEGWVIVQPRGVGSA